jgi:tetratricopeptide (TPR) repeat protein
VGVGGFLSVNPQLVSRLTLIVLVTIAASARGDNRSIAREHYYKGTRAFDLGAYDEAIAEYTAAYKAKEDPALLYNLGQAHRLAGHASEALRFYKTYLARMPDPANVAEVQTKIAELQKVIQQERKTQTEMPPDQAISPLPTPVEKSLAEAPVDRSAGRTKKIAGSSVGAVGLACLATGIAFGALAQSLSDQLTSLDSSMGTFDSGKDQAAKTDQIVEGVFLGIGAAAVVVGATMLALGYTEARRARRSQAWLEPALSPRGGGLRMQVAF